MGTSFVLAGVLIFSIAFGQLGFVKEKGNQNTSPVLASASSLYQDFVCFCCGQDIGECTCGEAEEKRNLVSRFVSEGLDKAGVYKEMIKTYGQEILFDQVIAAEIREELVAEAPQERPIISIDPEIIDFGDVPKKEVVSRDFTIENKGKTNLVIDNLNSSCGCTTAQVFNQGIEGPVYGMEGHGDFKNPKDWSTTITPGEEAILRVFYDPFMHEDLVGPVTRTVTVVSNDPIDTKTKVTIELNQL